MIKAGDLRLGSVVMLNSGGARFTVTKLPAPPPTLLGKTSIRRPGDELVGLVGWVFRVGLVKSELPPECLMWPPRSARSDEAQPGEDGE